MIFLRNHVTYVSPVGPWNGTNEILVAGIESKRSLNVYLFF